MPILQCTSTFLPSALFSSIRSHVELKMESRSSAGLSSLLNRVVTMPMAKCSWSVGAERLELMIESTKFMLVERRESMFEAAR